ncbi:MAG: arginase family protein [bacterium]
MKRTVRKPAQPTGVPHTRTGARPSGSTERFASLVRPDLTGAEVGLLGLADDLGVRLNGGRAGAADGPGAIRGALGRYGVAEPAGIRWPVVGDAGDVVPAAGSGEAALARTHDRVVESAAHVAGRVALPIGLGGGHDLTYPFVRGVMQAKGKRGGRWAGVYFDAHLDVRPTVGSGMAFRKLIDESGIGSLLVIGANTLVNKREHAEWFAGHGGVFADDDLGERAMAGELDAEGITEVLGEFDHLFVSFDLDVLDGSHAPGVSAVNPAGLSVREGARLLSVLCQHPKLACLDIMELCPTHDEPAGGPGRTARVAAHMLLSAVQGWKVGRLLRG